MSIGTRLLKCLLVLALVQPCLAQPSLAQPSLEQDSKQNFPADLQKAIGEKQYDQAIALLDQSNLGQNPSRLVVDASGQARRRARPIR